MNGNTNVDEIQSRYADLLTLSIIFYPVWYNNSIGSFSSVLQRRLIVTVKSVFDRISNEEKTYKIPLNFYSQRRVCYTRSSICGWLLCFVLLVFLPSLSARLDSFFGTRISFIFPVRLYVIFLLIFPQPFLFPYIHQSFMSDLYTLSPSPSALETYAVLQT